MKSLKSLWLMTLVGLVMAVGLASCKKEEAPATATTQAPEPALSVATTAQADAPDQPAAQADVPEVQAEPAPAAQQETPAQLESGPKKGPR